MWRAQKESGPGGPGPGGDPVLEILLVLAGSRGPSTVQLSTKEPGFGPGDLGRRLQELVRIGHQKS